MRKLLVAAALSLSALTLSPSALAQQRLDGNWWRDQMHESLRIGFVLGYLQGVDNASNMMPFSICGALNSPHAKVCYDVAWTATSQDTKQYRAGQVGQYLEGLNTFYADYRNRRVQIPGAMNYVGRSMIGTPAAELEQMVERMRQANAN